jgi:hypothetical protein
LSLRVDKKLNIVIPIQRGMTTVPREPQEGDPPDAPKDMQIPNIEGYVYALPLNEAAFKANYEIIARTYTKIFTGGLGVVAGPRTAAFIMADVAREMKIEEKLAGLLMEIRRLSMFATLTEKGWEQVPLDHALKNKMLDEDEVSEVENALAFFIVASAMNRKDEMRPIMLGMASFWGTLPMSLSFTEFLGSLKTLTKPASSTGKKAAASSVPR